MLKIKTDAGLSAGDSFGYYVALLWFLTAPWSLFALQAGMIILMVTGLFRMFSDREYRWHPRPLLIAAALFIILRIISGLLSPDPGSSVRAAIRMEWPVLSLFFVRLIRLNPHQYRILLRVLMISAGLVAVYGTVQFFTGIDLFRDRRMDPLWNNFYRSTGGYNFYLTFAGNQLMFFFLCLGVLISERRRRPQILYGFILVLILLSLLTTFARSTWMAALIVLPVGLLFYDRRWFFRIGLPLILLGILMVIAVPDLQKRFVSIFDFSQNEGRLTIFSTSWEILKDCPLFGIGPGFFPDFFWMYYESGFYDTVSHVHNDIFHMAVVSGLITLVAWLTLWGIWFYYIISSLIRTGNDPFLRAVLLGCVLGIGAILTAGLFQCYYLDLENNLVWHLIAVMALQFILWSRDAVPPR